MVWNAADQVRPRVRFRSLEVVVITRSITSEIAHLLARPARGDTRANTVLVQAPDRRKDVPDNRTVRVPLIRTTPSRAK